jgi:hypothetical protein
MIVDSWTNDRTRIERTRPFLGRGAPTLLYLIDLLYLALSKKLKFSTENCIFPSLLQLINSLSASTASATNEFGANHRTRGWIIDIIVGIFVDNKKEANE